MTAMNECSVDQCQRPSKVLGLCTMHYNRRRRTGDVGCPERMSRAGAGNSHWKGGRVRGGGGRKYWMLHLPKHPNANTIGYVLEHRVVMERHLGRFLRSDEIVHHINGDTFDNSISNLELMTQSEHCRHHFTKVVSR